MTFPFRLPAALAALLLLGPAQARADRMAPPDELTYHWSITPDPNRAGGIHFALRPDGRLALAMGAAAFIPAAAVSASTPGTSFQPLHYNLTLRLTESRVGATGDVSFPATLAATNAGLTNTFSDPLTQHLELVRTFSRDAVFFDFTATPQPPTAGLGGPGAPPTLLGVRVVWVGAGVASFWTPEPSGLVLGGLALGCVALARRRRRGGRAG